MSTSWQLAQLNIGKIRGTMDSPVMAEFAAALADVNGLAEASPGFVWRLKDDTGVGATGIKAFPDPLILVNMSVWMDSASLKNYVYRGLHGRFFARRQEWFEKFSGMQVVLWWIPAGHIPTVDEAKERLATLERLGPTPAAFTFKDSFPAPADSISPA